ncbi:hypothetical protein BHM03_00059211 [Ensete ventricosum]|nr:hypothetical protein BHM03_00059211 [Ensete ventricosum]
MGSFMSTVSRKNVTVTLHEVTHRFEFRSVFHAPYDFHEIESRKMSGGMGQRSLACMRECSALLWLALALAPLGGESAISGVEGWRLFSPRRGMDSRARNGGGCAAIGAGFTAALRSYGNSNVERATAASAIGVESATAATFVWEGWWLPLL